MVYEFLGNGDYNVGSIKLSKHLYLEPPDNRQNLISPDYPFIIFSLYNWKNTLNAATAYNKNKADDELYETHPSFMYRVYIALTSSVETKE